MNILFDARFIRTDFHDGISRYSTELGNALAKLTKVTFLIHDTAQLSFLPKNAEYIKIHSPVSVLEPFTARILNKYQPDVVYSPMQTLGPAGRNFKLILTIHDLIYYRHKTPPHNLPAAVRAGWRLYHASYTPQRITLNQADLIATVSHTVMREADQHRMTKRPMVVVTNAPRDLTQYASRASTQKAPRNIVYMGSFMPYKNVETLITGMRWLPDHTLHLLSKITPKRRAELEALIPKNAKVVFHNGVSDKEYAELLADRAILATGSLDEGYGIPIAEALGMGVPAIVSNIPIFHEVAAGGALYFDPHKPKDFADHVLQLNKKAIREELAQLGTQHISSYTWENSARALLAAIKSLV